MTLPTASIQLYTLAQAFSDDMAGSLERLAALGLTEVEAFDFVRRPAEIRAALDAAGLTAPLGHAPLLSDTLWTPDGSIPTPAPEVVLDAAAEIGMTTVIDPYAAPERWLTEDGVADLAERINHVAGVAAERGMRVGYHNHSQEFVASFDGQTAYERFVQLTDDRVVIELDAFWAQAGGQDVPALASRLGDRLVALHVKDGFVPPSNPMAPDAEPFASSALNQCPAGEGGVPLAETLRAGEGSIAHAIIEYDNPPGDVFEAIAASLAFLREGGFVR